MERPKKDADETPNFNRKRGGGGERGGGGGGARAGKQTTTTKEAPENDLDGKKSGSTFDKIMHDMGEIMIILGLFLVWSTHGLTALIHSRTWRIRLRTLVHLCIKGRR